MKILNPIVKKKYNRLVKIIKMNDERITVIEIDGVKYSYLKEVGANE